MPKLIFWPNADAGSEEISTAIREYREKKIIKNAWYVKNLDHELFFQVLKLTKCLVGNTSAAIREGSFMVFRVYLSDPGKTAEIEEEMFRLVMTLMKYIKN